MAQMGFHFSRTVALLATLVFPMFRASAQIVTGAPAIDGIGQYDQTSFTDPVFTFDKDGPNDGPSKLGMSSPKGMAVDQTGRRLFMADYDSGRVLVFALDSQNRPTSRFPTNVLGQPNFALRAESAGPASMKNPTDVEYSPSTQMLFVADTGNSRVLVFDVASITDGENAIRVLGQPDFSTTTETVSQSGMGFPVGLALDDVADDGTPRRLFVSTSSGCRVLVFDITSIENGELAQNILGKSDYTDATLSGAPTQQNFRGPAGMTYNSIDRRLFVADSDFFRVLVFDTQVLANNASASDVICQNSFTSFAAGAQANRCGNPQDVAYDNVNDRLFVSDSLYNRVQVYNDAGPGMPDFDNSSNATIGQLAPPASSLGLSQSRVYGPTGLAYVASSSTLYVGDGRNNRLMVFESQHPATTNPNAIDALGQYTGASYTSPVSTYFKSGAYDGPNMFGLRQGVYSAIDSVRHRLFVSDSQGRRVLVFNLNEENELVSRVPVSVLGQVNFSVEGFGVAESVMNQAEGLAYDKTNDRLFVVDSVNRRVLVFDTNSITTGENAAFVLGQPNFTSSTAAVTQAGMSQPYSLVLDEANQLLFVSDSGGRRVLVYDVASLSNGENAINVLGQPDFTSSAAALTASGMSSPRGLAYDQANRRLFISDDGYERVLVYDVTSITNGEAATGVLCQNSFTASGSGSTSTTCSDPRGLAYDASLNTLYLADYSNNRVLAFNAAEVTNGEAATHVLGQADFTSATAGVSATKFTLPTDVSVNGSTNQLYVGTRARLLIFPTRYLLEYSGTSFSESDSNNGSIGTSRSVTLKGDVFSVASGALTRGVHYTITGVPAGLTEVITITSPKSATISFSGNAAAHEAANNVSSITLTFLDAAFNNGLASSYEGNSKVFSMTFNDSVLCFKGVLPKPTVKVKRSVATVQLPTGILPSAACAISATATTKKIKKPKTRGFKTGKSVTTLSQLTRGRWQFSYVVTTKALGTSKTSAVSTATVK